MSSAVPFERRRPFGAAVIFGAWAAAIALAPSLAMKAVLAAPAVAIPIGLWTLARAQRWPIVFLISAILLPPLPIPIGDSGPHPSLLIAALGVFAGLLWLGDWRIGPSNVTRALAALFGVMLASVSLAAFYSGAEAAAGS